MQSIARCVLLNTLQSTPCIRRRARGFRHCGRIVYRHAGYAPSAPDQRSWGLAEVAADRHRFVTVPPQSDQGQPALVDNPSASFNRSNCGSNVASR